MAAQYEWDAVISGYMAKVTVFVDGLYPVGFGDIRVHLLGLMDVHEFCALVDVSYGELCALAAHWIPGLLPPTNAPQPAVIYMRLNRKRR